MMNGGAAPPPAPAGCARDDDVTCTRGPDNLLVLSVVMSLVPGVLVRVLPTVMMVCVYRVMKRRTRDTLPPSLAQATNRAIAGQCLLYLAVLYISLIFNLVSAYMSRIQGQRNLVATMLAGLFTNLYGVWMLGIYLFFRVKKKKKKPTTNNKALPPRGATEPGDGTTTIVHQALEKLHD